MITLYQQRDSGNCYKVRLALSLLKRPFQTVEINSRDGSTRRPDFLRRNPAGQVPSVELEDGRYLAQSNAIVLHLCEGSSLVPADSYDRAKAYEWLFFEQYSHEPTIAVRRALSVYAERRASATPERMADLLEKGRQALRVMELRLETADWLAGSAFSVADIALFAYTHMADDGGYDLAEFPGIGRWLARVVTVPGYVPIDA